VDSRRVGVNGSRAALDRERAALERRPVAALGSSVMRNALRATFAVATAIGIAGCDRRPGRIESRGSVSTVPHMVISEVMANPRAVPDERGEWFELHNLDSNPIDLRRWIIASKNDRAGSPRGMASRGSTVMPSPCA